jgi:hypothetical protein
MKKGVSATLNLTESLLLVVIGWGISEQTNIIL